MTLPPHMPWFIAIGASGSEGLDDIKAVLGGLPPSLSAIVLVVLHRPWGALSHLADVLGRTSPMPVQVAVDGGKFEIGTVYVGKPADHLMLAANSFGLLLDDDLRHYRNRTVDLLFRSVAEHGGNRIIGVVLSGSLDDGSRGLAAINEMGGLSMVLTPALSGPKGMPGNAINFDGPIDVVGTSLEIAAAINVAVGGAGPIPSEGYMTH